MYLDPPAAYRLSEMGLDIKVVTGPPMTSPSTWTGTLALYYWAMQVDFYNLAGTNVGGGHFGIQVYNWFSDGTKNTMANWGCYDNAHSVAGQPAGQWTSAADGVTTSGSAIITSATGGFTAGMVGRVIQDTNGKVSTAKPIPTIASVQSTNQATMSGNSLGSTTGDTFTIGTAVFRSSRVIDSWAFGVPIGDGAVTQQFDWSYGEWIRFRCFKSPKQNYLASELNDNVQPAPHSGTNQQTDEVAYRITIQNLTRGWPPVIFRDILVQTDHPSPMNWSSTWTEVVSTIGSDLSSTWPYSPDCRMRQFIIDGPRLVKSVTANYANAGASTNCNISMGTTEAQMLGNTTKVTAHGTALTPPSGFWDSVTNVAPTVPNPDLSARVATPRPWY